MEKMDEWIRKFNVNFAQASVYRDMGTNTVMIRKWDSCQTHTPVYPSWQREQWDQSIGSPTYATTELTSPHCLEKSFYIGILFAIRMVNGTILGHRQGRIEPIWAYKGNAVGRPPLGGGGNPVELIL